MNKRKKVLLFALSSLLTFSAISSCKTRDPNEGKVFRSAFESDVPSLDPINVGDTTSHDVAHNIYMSGLLQTPDNRPWPETYGYCSQSCRKLESFCRW